LLHFSSYDLRVAESDGDDAKVSDWSNFCTLAQF
jgi:hypothetical protein